VASGDDRVRARNLREYMLQRRARAEENANRLWYFDVTPSGAFVCQLCGTTRIDEVRVAMYERGLPADRQPDSVLCVPCLRVVAGEAERLSAAMRGEELASPSPSPTGRLLVQQLV
jgi:hypothetical protein